MSAVEKWTLPEEPVKGSSVKAGGTVYTRDSNRSGSELSVDGWRDDKGNVRTWAELFVIGSGTVESAPGGKVVEIVNRFVSNQETRDALIKALIDTPTVDTTGVLIPARSKRYNVGDEISRDDITDGTVTANDISHVTQMEDADGDKWRRDGSSERWNMNSYSGDNKPTLSLLDAYPPFTVLEVS